MITISELRPEDDLTPLLDLCKDFFAEYESYHDEFFDIDDLKDADISGRFLQSIESDDSVTFIALVVDKIVGYIAVDIREQPPFYKIKKAGAAWGLMVAKDYRRKGVASQLLTEARVWLNRRGIKYFTAYTAVANEPAIRFYKRNGLTALHMNFIGDSSAG